MVLELCVKCGSDSCDNIDHDGFRCPEPDVTKCPKCGGYADNGFDRCYPPSPYYCSKCMKEEGYDEA